MAKPCLGYPSKTAAAMAMIASGTERSLVAERLGLSLSALGALVDDQGRPRRDARAQRGATPRDLVAPVTISLATLEMLRPYARRSDMTVEALVRSIVDTVALERLVDAVLDDREGS